MSFKSKYFVKNLASILIQDPLLNIFLTSKKLLNCSKSEEKWEKIIPI